MVMNRFSFYINISLFATLVLVSCSPSSSQESTPLPQPTDTEQILPSPTETQSIQPTATSQLPQETTAATAESTSSCTVLQDLNLRTGPGTAYRPPIRALPANSVVTPLGFAPQGIPGGQWAYVQDTATQDKGWVSAGSQYISCTIDPTTLPPMDFGTPPPPPLPQSTQTSDPDGNGFCIDPDSGIQCVGTFSKESLFQFQIIKDGVELGANDGVEQVSFAVKKNGDHIFDSIETNAAYCIFGGNRPCNPWTTENGVYKWSPGGTTVESGEYEMEIFATLNGEQSRWAVNFKLSLP